jgi:LmbE family N-acetylglucosaminyl deacetylase
VSTVLCIGAHGDDIEIGCAPVLKLAAADPELRVHWLVLSADGTPQADRFWFKEAFLGLMRLPGNEAPARCRGSIPSGFAEGFNARQLLLG